MIEHRLPNIAVERATRSCGRCGSFASELATRLCACCATRAPAPPPPSSCSFCLGLSIAATLGGLLPSLLLLSGRTPQECLEWLISTTWFMLSMGLVVTELVRTGPWLSSILPFFTQPLLLFLAALAMRQGRVCFYAVLGLQVIANLMRGFAGALTIWASC
jgi:hypothetical protein